LSLDFQAINADDFQAVNVSKTSGIANVGGVFSQVLALHQQRLGTVDELAVLQR
jgi:hypothetical protein